jgi:hypothetical protein
MIDPNTNEAPQAGGRKPTHLAYWVKDRENHKGDWHPIGVGWAHGDGKGLTLSLDLQPRDGRITVRLLEERPSEPEQGG